MAKIAGVYKITNTINGKVYIGASKDIRGRWKRYRWAVDSTKSYMETNRTIIKAMRKHGIDAFKFEAIDTSEAMNDKLARYIREAELIREYNSDDPSRGYNGTSGKEQMLISPNTSIRPQGIRERLRRAKAVFEYDTKKDYCMLYLGGSKAWGEKHGYTKDVSSHTLTRGSLIEHRYYLVYADPVDRKIQADKIYRKYVASVPMNTAGYTRALNRYHKYMDAVERVNEIAKEFGL